MIGNYQLLPKEKCINNNISETIYIAEYDYTLNKLGSDIEYIDLEARDYFYEGVLLSKLKCITGFNYHGKRNKIINDGLIKNECPRCSFAED